jgi:hypothetical protein
MEDIIGELAKGFLRGIGYILAEFFFWFICYWIGWPICKLLTLGAYPKPQKRIYLDGTPHTDVWCPIVGLIVVLGVAFYFIGVFG